MEALTILFLVLLTAIIFIIWLAVSVGRLIVSAIFGIGTRKPNVIQNINAESACQSSNCRAMNPTYARFCKRCGKSLGLAPRVPMRYVA